MTITDWDSGKSIRKPISVSPYRARSTAPGSDVSVVEILLDTNSPDGGESLSLHLSLATLPYSSLIVTLMSGMYSMFGTRRLSCPLACEQQSVPVVRTSG